MKKEDRKNTAADSNAPDLDRIIHEPARLQLMSLLYVVESADFILLQQRTKLSAGNLSTHMGRLESAGYVEITKEFVNRKPHTLYKLTDLGRAAFDRYRATLDRVLKPESNT